MNKLTTTEAAKIIGVLVGGLIPYVSNIQELRSALRDFVDNERYWLSLEALRPKLGQIAEETLNEVRKKSQ